MPIDLSQHLEVRRRQQRQPSLSAAFAVSGEVTWSGMTGDADPFAPEARQPEAKTQYRIASITKPQVAVAVLKLVEEGRVDLSDRMDRHIPDAPCGQATLAQFLSHTSGLVAEIDGPWWEREGGCTWEELVAMDLGEVAAPGLGYHYSNVGYGILGRLLEVVHKQSWDEVLSEVIWEPLGMTRTSREPIDADHARGAAIHPLQELVHPEPVHPYLAMGPAGELWSTPSDLVRFGSFLAGLRLTDAPLRPETLQLLRRPAAISPTWEDGYGLGVMLSNGPNGQHFFHTGTVPGFTAQLAFDPRTGAAIALCGNATTWCGGVLDWLDLATAHLPDQALPVAPRALPARLQALQGLWYRGPRQVMVRVLPTAIEIAPTDAPGMLSRVELAEDGRLVGTSANFAWGEELLVDRENENDPAWFTLARLHYSREPYDPASQVPGGLTDGGWRPMR